VSHDGGDTWQVHPIGSASDNSQNNPPDGCTIRTDSHGTAYVFGVGTANGSKTVSELMSTSTNGGNSWSPPRPVVSPVNQPGIFDPAQDRDTIDGVAGERSDLAPAPSVDIANGAPTGADATDRMVMSYVSGPLATPHVFFTESTNHGATWAPSRSIETSGDRSLFTAPAISPDGKNVWVVYNAFLTPYRTETTSPRSIIGVVKHASASGSTGSTGAFSEVHRGTPGDPRGSSANSLTSEFLGDYVYAAASRDYGAAVWNDSRNDADCAAIDAFRMQLVDGNTSATPPAPQQQCAPNFGNSDIYGGSYPNP
jgi:hypothetical protein